ncbi:unnamed protein product [Microthlaspi erraticum]|uniref:RNase H type-1 domain-containing protein n=1 Tax=Microthlaspi erraticum TaxID=1685480 RepID=A0A6D2KM87_9BRAS|nr:unnamed protein product [Microthlaspi erraticum]
MSPIPAPPIREWTSSLYSNLYEVLHPESDHPLKEKSVKIAPWLLWRIWKNRNELIHKGREYNAQEVANKAVEDAEEWEGRMEVKTREAKNVIERQSRSKWRPPTHGQWKCNTDGSWSKNQDKSGVGWILRDHNGNMIWMGAKAYHRLESALETELEALRWAIISVTRLNYEKVTFETDSSTAANLVNGRDRWPSLGPIIADIQQLLQKFRWIHIEYTPRESNTVADRTTKEAISFPGIEPKLYSCTPTWASRLIEMDKIV